MKYQLILQWPASSIEDYDAMIEVENILREKLQKCHKVDGHDAGSGEVNIFIHTNEPTSAFHEVRKILGSNDFWVDTRAAYRELTKNDYSILWPEGLTEFKIV